MSVCTQLALRCQNEAGADKAAGDSPSVQGNSAAQEAGRGEGVSVPAPATEVAAGHDLGGSALSGSAPAGSALPASSDGDAPSAPGRR